METTVYAAQVHTKSEESGASAAGTYGVKDLFDRSIALQVINDEKANQVSIAWSASIRQLVKGALPDPNGAWSPQLAMGAFTKVRTDYLKQVVSLKKRGQHVSIYVFDGPPNDDFLKRIEKERALWLIVRKDKGIVEYPSGGDIPFLEETFWLTGPPLEMELDEAPEQKTPAGADDIAATYERHADVLDEDAIRLDALLTAPFAQHARTVATSVLESAEFNSLCPWSGMPDFGTITIEYEPFHKLVEMKSLKFYLTSFRNVGITQERCAQRILEDLAALTLPKWMIVTIRFSGRGGMTNTAVAKHKI